MGKDKQTNQDMRENLEALLKSLKVNGEIWEQCTKELSRQMFRLYEQYVAAGFTTEQAFSLIKTRGLSLMDPPGNWD